MRVYVGIDLHRKRSQVAVLESDGSERVNRNLRNDSAELAQLLGGLPAGTPVAFDAAYGWSWLLELFEEQELDPHLAHPSRCKAIAAARLTDDRLDARTLAQLPRADLLPEAWIASTRLRWPPSSTQDNDTFMRAAARCVGVGKCRGHQAG